MLKVLLCDDEPFIIQGLRVLIDWKSEGFEIVASASNGQEALEYLENNEVDLIIADIQMPIMTGLELLEKVKTEKISDAYFIFLTGYKDFSYAQQALRYDCKDYVLKPVEKNDILRILRNISKLSEENVMNEESKREMEQAFLARNVMALLFGKYDKKNVEYVNNHLQISGDSAYVDIEFSYSHDTDEDAQDGEQRDLQRKLYSVCRDFLKEDGGHCIFDVSQDEKSYDVGFLYSDYMAAKANCSMDEYLISMLSSIRVDFADNPIRMFVGKKVSRIEEIAKSYTSACVVKSLEAFRAKKEIYYYEKEVSVAQSGLLLCKNSLDELVDAIEKNEPIRIRKSVEALFAEMQQTGVSSDTMNLNINYLLFQLIHLASEQDSELNQEEILRFIGEHSFEEGALRGSRDHLAHFSIEYGNYLEQLRKNDSRGVLLEIEKDVKEHYYENLTLRELGKKYYMNSSYLGQVFQKKYGQSFKDYLTAVRISEAERMLLKSDEKVSMIAERVGYKDSDYFIRKFIEAKGCTPSRYRKMHT